jgi:hypothetical protein
VIGLWLIAVASSAASPATGSAPVDAFIADLRAGRREAAIARVLEMNSLTGEPNAVATKEELVDKLLRCRYVSVDTRHGPSLYDVRWRCADGDYYSVLDPDLRPPQLIVFEFLTASAREEQLRHAMAPPPIISPRPDR